ncbi:MAG: TOBE domain-containing protein [Thermoplasmatota archaeon]
MRGIADTGSVSAAARAVGMDPANALRHIRRAESWEGAALVVRTRGGRGGGRAQLTPAGARVARAGSKEHAWRGFAGTYDPASGTTPVAVGRRTVFVAGPLPMGPVRLEIRPDDVSLARASPRRAHVAESPRNRWPARVADLRPLREGILEAHLILTGGALLSATLTRGAVLDLRLRAGSRVWATVKATAIQASPVRHQE